MRKKKWVKPFLEQENAYLKDTFEGSDKPVYLEIGMGMGDFITESALMHPEILWIGLERDETCIATAIKKAMDKGIENLFIMHVDASLIDECIKEKSIDRIYLHFSDPWPKTRTHKRRLTYPTFLTRYERILKDNGEIILKTDNLSFFEDSLEYFKESTFTKCEENRDYHSEDFNEPMTAYQRRFSEMGQPIYYARYINKV